MCIFARQDLTRDPPFSRLDLIACRNVLIYLSAQLQKKLMTMFHYALRPNGFLLLGSAETVGASADLFAAADRRFRLYVRKDAYTRTDFNFSVSDASWGRPPREATKPSPPAHTANTLMSDANRALLERFAPSGVVVDSDLRIVQFRGHTGTFLEPAPGDATLNILKMAREGLLFGLRSAITDARRTGKPARKDGLRIKHGGRVHDVSVEVLPIGDATSHRHFLILFQESTARDAAHGERRPKGRAGNLKASQRDKRMLRLQQELAASREYLQSIIQDLEAANEELQSANEEILSSNEELQSTNEELDTAKEELQSTNEELNTLNEELHGRNQELSLVNSDLLNLLASVHIAIVMVSRDQRIRRYTPMAEKVLNLIPTDVGRPIHDIKPDIESPDLHQLITQCIDEVITIEREVRDRQGNTYALRIRPYKNLENRIDGAVLALFDVDTSRRQQLEAQQARELSEAMLETMKQPVVILGADLRVIRQNSAFARRFKQADIDGQSIYEVIPPHADQEKLKTLLEDMVPREGHIESFDLGNGNGSKPLRVTARRLMRAGSKAAGILLSLDE
jgi:two-component system CheB/CheR fusion protein